MKAIILARGGSKVVPKKNIKLLNNKPLIAYPILAAQKTKNITNIYVSTDSEEIADVSRLFGALIIERPEELATDKSLDVDAFRHAVKSLNDYSDIVHLRATTPLVLPNIIDEAIEYFYENSEEATSLRSAHEFSESVYKFLKKEDKYWTGFFPHLQGEYYNMPRQNFVKSYLPNGYIDVVRPRIFMNKETFHGDKILSFITAHVNEIDTFQDFEILELKVKNVSI